MKFYLACHRSQLARNGSQLAHYVSQLAHHDRRRTGARSNLPARVADGSRPAAAHSRAADSAPPRADRSTPNSCCASPPARPPSPACCPLDSLRTHHALIGYCACYRYSTSLVEELQETSMIFASIHAKY